MTPTQTVQLVALISQIWPSMKLNEFTADAWHPLLEDIEFEAAGRAVNILAKTHDGYIAPSDIRRQVVRDAGLLPVSEATALQLAVTVAGNLGAGRRALPRPVQRAYDLMGGSQGFAAPESVIRPQFGRIYREVCAEFERDLLAGHIGRAIRGAALSELQPEGPSS